MKAPNDLSIAELIHLLGLEPLDSSLTLSPERREELGGATHRLKLDEARELLLGRISSALGFSSFDRPIEPGESRVLYSAPQLPFRPYLVAIPRTVSIHFQLDDVRARSCSLAHISATPIPSETLALIRLEAEAVSIGSQCSMHVTNISKQSQTFRGAILGTHRP